MPSRSTAPLIAWRNLRSRNQACLRCDVVELFPAEVIQVEDDRSCIEGSARVRQFEPMRDSLDEQIVILGIEPAEDVGLSRFKTHHLRSSEPTRETRPNRDKAGAGFRDRPSSNKDCIRARSCPGAFCLRRNGPESGDLGGLGIERPCLCDLAFAVGFFEQMLRQYREAIEEALGGGIRLWEREADGVRY